MLPIAWVAEYLYCQRASFYFLTGFENGEEENVYIQSGRGVHLNIDIPGKRYRASYSEAKAVTLWSANIGLIGKADVIRIYSDSIIPIEYKSGTVKKSDFHKFQLTLQAICIEEQLKKQVKEGFVYFYQLNTHQRYLITQKDKAKAKSVLVELRSKLEKVDIKTFQKLNLSNCLNCSFYDICIPQL